MADRELTDLELERWLAGDLPEPRRARATAADQARLDELRAHHAAWLATVDVASELQAISARRATLAGPSGPARSRPAAWRWALSGGALAAAAAVAVVLVARPDGRDDELRTSGSAGPGSSRDLGDDSSGLRSKGASVGLVVHAAAGSDSPAASRRLASGDTVRPGDRLRFDVTVSGPGYLAIVGIDGAGAATVYYPFGASAPAAIAPRSAGVLPGAIALDAAPGDERFYAVYGEQPFAIDAALFAGLRDGRGLAGLATAAVVLHKQPR